MSQKKFKDWIKKITYLEVELGKNVKYEQLEPFYVNTNSIVDIQKAAKKISYFLGLKGLTFIVGKFKQEENVAGNIELEQYAKEVYIEISEDLEEFEESLLSTLAHEITHKYMLIYNISCGKGSAHEYENEILTDITAVFLGLGKLMINGSHVKKTTITHENDTKIEETKKMNVGYLKIAELGFVYRLICTMRNISNKEMISNLTKDAELAVKQWSSYNKYFNSKFHETKFPDKIKSSLIKDMLPLQNNLNNTKECLNFLEDNYIKKTKKFLEHKNNEIILIRKILNSDIECYDPALRFLDTIKLNEWCKDTKHNIKKELKTIIQMSKDLKKVKKLILKKNKYPYKIA